jgi:hypothetical protein
MLSLEGNKPARKFTSGECGRLRFIHYYRSRRRGRRRRGRRRRRRGRRRRGRRRRQRSACVFLTRNSKMRRPHRSECH